MIKGRETSEPPRKDSKVMRRLKHSTITVQENGNQTPKTGMGEFENLMRQVAELPEDKRQAVGFYVQGFLAANSRKQPVA